MTELAITKTLFLKATPQRVWRFLTEAKLLATWFHEGKQDVVKGGEWNLLTNSDGKDGQTICHGKVLEFIPPSGTQQGKLVHSFTHDHLQGVETICHWTLMGAGAGTVLTLHHTGFEKFTADPFGMAANHDVGWDEHFIRLRRVTM